MSKGILYYMTGEKMAVRLAVSIHTLRQHYDGPVTIFSEGRLANQYTHAIGERYGCTVKEVQFNATDGKNTTYLNACLCAQQSPYETTLWIDADTIICVDVQPLLDITEKHGFVLAAFSDWLSGSGQIRKRIENWRGILPDEWIDRALEPGRPAINCGVFGCRYDSRLVKDWHDLARKGQHTRIPDEVCCQIMMAQPQYNVTVVPQKWNCSCKYGQRWIDEARIVHYHGNKHCRFHDDTGEPIHNCLLWYKHFQLLRQWWPVKNYIGKDRQLNKNLKRYDAWRASQKKS